MKYLYLIVILMLILNEGAAAVPEPASLLLLGVSLAGGLLKLRKKSN